jgi:hypothetical protein
MKLLSIDEYIQQEKLNESIGIFSSKYHLPNRFISYFFNTNTNQNSIGENSKIESCIINNKSAFTKCIKKFNDAYLGFILIDGESRYTIYKTSPRKYFVINNTSKVFNEPNNSRSSFGVTNIFDRVIDYYSNPKEINNLQELSSSKIFEVFEDDLKEGKSVQIDIVYPDSTVRTKIQNRQDSKHTNDKLEQSNKMMNYTWTTTNDLTTQRSIKIKAKLLMDIERKIGDVEKHTKQEILNNLDKAFSDILDNLAQGYTWYAKPKELGDKLVKNIDLSQLENLGKLYDLLKKIQGSKDNIEIQNFKKEIKSLL